MRRSIRVAFAVMALTSAVTTLSFGPASAAPDSGVPAVPPVKPAKPAFRITVPTGYEKVTVAGHTALCEPNDVSWVKQSLTDAKPAVTTGMLLPDAIVAGLKEKREGLIKQMVSNLALADDKAVNAFLDGELVSKLNKLQAAKPPIFFLVTTQEKLADLTKTGWGEPKFHYNGVAKAAAYDQNIPFSLDEEMDDTVLPIFYNEKDKDKDAMEMRVKNFAALVQGLDTRLLGNAANQSNPLVFSAFLSFIQEKQIEPLKLRRDQAWLGMGISNFLAAKYTSVVTGVPNGKLLEALTSEENLFPVSARGIDLAKPLEESAMKKEAVPYYAVSMQRKATAVVAEWVHLAGESAIPDTLKAVKAKMPADGAALVKLIQDVTTTDLGKYLAPQ
jgi:hypothetical protein